MTSAGKQSEAGKHRDVALKSLFVEGHTATKDHIHQRVEPDRFRGSADVISWSYLVTDELYSEDRWGRVLGVSNPEVVYTLFKTGGGH